MGFLFSFCQFPLLFFIRLMGPIDIDKCFVQQGHVDNVCIVLYCIATEADPRTFSGIPIVIEISTVIGCINVNTLIRIGRVLMIPWVENDIPTLQVEIRVWFYNRFRKEARRRTQNVDETCPSTTIYPFQSVVFATFWRPHGVQLGHDVRCQKLCH